MLQKPANGFGGLFYGPTKFAFNWASIHGFKT